MKHNPSPAVFLDRDGVLCEDSGYPHRISDLKLLAGVGEALRDLKQKGFLLVVITNQSGVARGFFSLLDVERFHAEIQRQLFVTHAVQIDEFFICPHHPEGTVPEFTRICSCRKPKTGLIEMAQTKFQIDMAQSYLVGDRESDILCANNSNLKSILIAPEKVKKWDSANYKVASLKDASALICG